MLIARLGLANVRNYASLEFEPAPGLNLIVGANAVGKTNLLEAIALLGTGKSFRTSREAEVVTLGLPVATVSGEARLKAGPVRLSCTISVGPSGTRKLYTINGHGVRYARYLGTLRVVSFIPAHLQLVGGPPSLRRALLNAALAQESSLYYASLAAYGRHLAHKASLLRGAVEADEALLATYNEHLVETGTELILARRAFVAELDTRARVAYRSWVGDADGPLELIYASNVSFETNTQDAIASAFAQQLCAQRDLELRRKTCLVGPHRDDLKFRLGGCDAASFRSQGQQRMAVLALKVAEYSTLEARAGEAPIMLLDDVLSELDLARRDAFLAGIGSVEQAFVTATSDVDAPKAVRYRIVDGRVEAA